MFQRYYVFVSQLETQQQQNQLTLQTLWFHTEPVMEMMEVVANIVRTLNKVALEKIDLFKECIGGYSRVIQ